MRYNKPTLEERFLKFMLYFIVGLLCWIVSTHVAYKVIHGI